MENKNKKYTGQKLIDMLPASCMEFIKVSFQDFNLDFEKDIKDCQLYLGERGDCFLKYKSEQQYSSGELIACFKIDGTGTYYCHPSRLGDNMRMTDKKKEEERKEASR